MRVLSDFADGDKLYIFDCCFAATGAVQHQETEYLAASAMELDATQHQQNCLTHRLTELLKRFKGTPTTLAFYHSHLLAEMDHPMHRLDRTPVYVPSFSRPAIVLETMPQGGSALRDLQTFNISPAKVLVTITLQGRATTPNVQEFERFLLSHVPGDVANIKVEAAFESESQVFLVTMPAAVWALLRDDENINFVAHVKSNNILQTENRNPHWFSVLKEWRTYSLARNDTRSGLEWEHVD